jgi:hypothetical protein
MTPLALDAVAASYDHSFCGHHVDQLLLLLQALRLRLKYVVHSSSRDRLQGR